MSHIIDLFEFVRTGEESTGILQALELPRLLNEAPTEVPQAERMEYTFCWHACSEVRALSLAAAQISQRQYLLRLAAQGQTWLACQRCLQPYLQPLAFTTLFEIVRSEAQAEAAALDSEVDTIVGSASFDLRNLIEEELLLALPLVPKHPICPVLHKSLVSGRDGSGAGAVSGRGKQRASPFAALAVLKRDVQ
jgi:uncharacterized protein